jgi:hypothetical protein
MFQPPPRVMFSAKPISAAPAGDDGTPPPLIVSGLARDSAQLAAAKDVLTAIPGPNQAIHTLTTGRRFSVGAALYALADKLRPVDKLDIATLSYSKRNVAQLLDLLDSGTVRNMTLLVSKFFAQHFRELLDYTREEFQARRQRVACARSHAKVAVFHFADGRAIVCESSGNLRANGNWEQLTLINSPELAEFHSRWITKLVNHVT